MKSYKIRTPNAWVRTVTKNIAIDILRKNGKQYRVKELLVLPDYTGPPDNVADILKVLSESEQQIMYLRYWEKYNLKEIAELIKMKYSSVKYIHRAAKKKLIQGKIGIGTIDGIIMNRKGHTSCFEFICSRSREVWCGIPKALKRSCF